MTPKSPTLEQYANRRFVLSGSAVREQFPYCRSLEEIAVQEGTAGPITSFALYDYLDLAGDPRIRTAASKTAIGAGTGGHASRLVGGEHPIHRALERDLSDFMGVEDTLTLVSGYGTNVGLVSHVLTKGDVIFVDESSHNSIMTGTQLSRADTLSFRHNDLDHLKALLMQCRHQYNRALIVIEGLYSMDGDIPDLPRILELAHRHGAWLMIDEAHSIGVLGASGRGLTEHFGIPASEVDLIVGTLSKSLVSCGGFIAAKSRVVEWLRYTLPAFVYSVGMAPPVAAAARAALAVIRAEPERLTRLHKSSRHFRDGARARGLNVGTSAGAGVIPILFSDMPSALGAARAALSSGYYVPPIVQIAVPKDAPRLRFFITARHTEAELDGVLDVLAPFAVERPQTLVDGQLETFGTRAEKTARAP